MVFLTSVTLAAVGLYFFQPKAGLASDNTTVSYVLNKEECSYTLTVEPDESFRLNGYELQFSKPVQEENIDFDLGDDPDFISSYENGIVRRYLSESILIKKDEQTDLITISMKAGISCSKLTLKENISHLYAVTGGNREDEFAVRQLELAPVGTEDEDNSADTDPDIDPEPDADLDEDENNEATEGADTSEDTDVVDDEDDDSTLDQSDSSTESENDSSSDEQTADQQSSDIPSGTGDIEIFSVEALETELSRGDVFETQVETSEENENVSTNLLINGEEYFAEGGGGACRSDDDMFLGWDTNGSRPKARILCTCPKDTPDDASVELIGFQFRNCDGPEQPDGTVRCNVTKSSQQISCGGGDEDEEDSETIVSRIFELLFAGDDDDTDQPSDPSDDVDRVEDDSSSDSSEEDRIADDQDSDRQRDDDLDEDDDNPNRASGSFSNGDCYIGKNGGDKMYLSKESCLAKASQQSLSRACNNKIVKTGQCIFNSGLMPNAKRVAHSNTNSQLVLQCFGHSATLLHQELCDPSDITANGLLNNGRGWPHQMLTNPTALINQLYIVAQTPAQCRDNVKPGQSFYLIWPASMPHIGQATFIDTNKQSVKIYEGNVDVANGGIFNGVLGTRIQSFSSLGIQGCLIPKFRMKCNAPL
ncbi:MAG: hypothetical protein ACOCXQ_02275 [Patescibacteria group bacterium]